MVRVAYSEEIVNYHKNGGGKELDFRPALWYSEEKEAGEPQEGETPMRQFTYTITCPEGLHGRPAAQLVELAGGLDSVVTIQKGERAVAATRLMALMTLGVSRGDRVTVTLEGGDEEAAFRTVEQFFQEHM